MKLQALFCCALLPLLLGCPPAEETKPRVIASKSSTLPLGPDREAEQVVESEPASSGPQPQRIPHPDEGKTQLELLRQLDIRVGKVKLRVWVADTEPSRRLGLMHVRTFPEDHGMLFIYPRAERHSFWMKNTYVPLSLAYINADGSLDQILDMQPHDETSRPSKSSVRFILEVNQGWFERHGLKAGARLSGVTHLVGY